MKEDCHRKPGSLPVSQETVVVREGGEEGGMLATNYWSRGRGRVRGVPCIKKHPPLQLTHTRQYKLGSSASLSVTHSGCTQCG